MLLYLKRVMELGFTVRNPTEHKWDALTAKFPDLFLIPDSPASLPDDSGCWIRIIRVHVLGLEANHLCLIRTALGYGTVLMAACTCQGCSATGLVWFGLVLSRSWTPKYRLKHQTARCCLKQKEVHYVT
jgi:hypothetical protein